MFLLNTGAAAAVAVQLTEKDVTWLVDFPRGPIDGESYMFGWWNLYQMLGLMFGWLECRINILTLLVGWVGRIGSKNSELYELLRKGTSMLIVSTIVVLHPFKKWHIHIRLIVPALGHYMANFYQLHVNFNITMFSHGFYLFSSVVGMSSWRWYGCYPFDH